MAKGCAPTLASERILFNSHVVPDVLLMENAKRVAFDPVKICFLRILGIMFQAQLFTNPLEEVHGWHTPSCCVKDFIV